MKGNTEFEQLLIEQSNALTNIQPEKFNQVFERIAADTLEFFGLDRLTLFPNSMISLQDGRTFSVSREGIPKLNLNFLAQGNYPDYMQVLRVQRPWQIFDSESLKNHPLDPLRLLYQEGGRWHGIIQLKLFGQTWGALAFSHFDENATPLSEAQIQQLKIMSDAWLCFWQLASVARSLTPDGDPVVHEHDKLLQLSEKQRSVLSLLAQGFTAKQCAEKLFLSSRTIESHKYRMQNLLGLKSHNELIQFAIRNGLGIAKSK